MQVIICPNYEAMSIAAAGMVAELVRQNPFAVLALPTGGTPLQMYEELARAYTEEGLDFRHVVCFNLDEYDIDRNHRNSYRTFMDVNFYSHVNVDPNNAHMLDPRAEDVEAHCEQYERMITAAGGIDCCVLGIGKNGHLAFNEPVLTSLTSRTRRVALSLSTRKANARFFGGEIDDVPDHALSMGIGTIIESRRCILLAAGDTKAQAIREAVEGPLTAKWPASALQLHSNTTIVLDEEAAEELVLEDVYQRPSVDQPTLRRSPTAI